MKVSTLYRQDISKHALSCLLYIVHISKARMFEIRHTHYNIVVVVARQSDFFYLTHTVFLKDRRKNNLERNILCRDFLRPFKDFYLVFNAHVKKYKRLRKMLNG